MTTRKTLLRIGLAAALAALLSGCYAHGSSFHYRTHDSFAYHGGKHYGPPGHHKFGPPGHRRHWHHGGKHRPRHYRW